jgi:hypothetical protein
MFLKCKSNGTLVEVLTVEDLYNPCRSRILGRLHAGEEMQDPSMFPKVELMFPSNEPLPQCWLDAHYQDKSLKTIVIHA